METKNILSKKPLISLVVIVAIALTIYFFVLPANKQVTGKAVIVKGYGLSAYPLEEYPNTIQTKITIKPEIVKELASSQFTNVAAELEKAADFKNNFVNIVKNSDAPVPIQETSLDAVKGAASKLEGTFSRKAECLQLIGDIYSETKKDITFISVSDIVWQQCENPSSYNVAIMRHRFFTKNGNHICTQHETKVLSQSTSGKLMKDTTVC